MSVTLISAEESLPVHPAPAEAALPMNPGPAEAALHDVELVVKNSRVYFKPGSREAELARRLSDVQQFAGKWALASAAGLS